MEPTFRKLNRTGLRKIALGLLAEDADFEFSPDYMGVRMRPLDMEVDSTKPVELVLPVIQPSKEYTAVAVINPELYALGMISGPMFIPYTKAAVAPIITFKPHKKCHVKLDWIVEYKLLG